MRYYIFDRRTDMMEMSQLAAFSHHILGEGSFDVFHADDGFRRLRYMIRSNQTEWLEHAFVFDDTSSEHTISEFLDILDKFKELRFYDNIHKTGSKLKEILINKEKDVFFR